ncbi:MAG: hypothetical protein AAGI52_17615 [Bacteroidota bacterium]
MRGLLFLVLLIGAPLLASAQDLQIVSLDVREPAAGTAELAVGVQNNRRTASHFSIRVSLPGASEQPQIRSTDRLAPGTRTEIVVRFDASGLARPCDGSVSLRNHRRIETDTRTFTLPASAPPPAEERPEEEGRSPTGDEAPPPTIVMAIEVATEIQAPEAALRTVSALTFRFRTGDDDLRHNSALLVRVYGRDRTPLTGYYSGDEFGNRANVVWTTVKDSQRPGVRAPTWENGSTHEVRVPLREPTTLADIESISIRLLQGREGFQLECVGCTDDNWKMQELYVDAFFSYRPGDTQPETGQVNVFRFSEGDRSAEFSADLPMLVLTPIGPYVPGESRTMRGVWRNEPLGRILR